MPDDKFIAELRHRFDTEPATANDIEDAMLNTLGLHGDGTRSFVEVAGSFLTAIEKQSIEEQLKSLTGLARPLGEAVWVFDEEIALSSKYRDTLNGFATLALNLLGSDVLKALPKEKSFEAAGICLSVLSANAGQKSLAEMLRQSHQEIRCSNKDCSEYGAAELKCRTCGSYSSPQSMFISS